MPPSRLISPAQHEWNALTTSRCSSGSSRVERALDPTMSQNMIVSWRRSAEEVGVIGAVGRGPVDGGFACLREARPTPHSEQNRACAEFACPQVRQMRGSAAPQCSQNLLPSFRLLLQLGHCIAAPPIASGQPSILLPAAQTDRLACRSGLRWITQIFSQRSQVISCSHQYLDDSRRISSVLCFFGVLLHWVGG